MPVTGAGIAFDYRDVIPNAAQPPWGQDPDGLAHDQVNWYVTNKWNVFQYKLSDDLTASARKFLNMNDATDASGPINGLSLALAGLNRSSFPPSGCSHFGDPDVATFNGHHWLFVPVEGCYAPDTQQQQTFLAVFDLDLAPNDHPTTMKLQCVDELYFQPTNAGMVAINPVNPSVLFSPGGSITGSGTEKMMTYTIHYENLPTCNLTRCLADLNAGAGWSSACLLTNGPGDSTQPMQLSQGLFNGVNATANQFPFPISHVGEDRGLHVGEPQGGVFSPDGTLFYFTNGGSYQGDHRDENALRVFDATTSPWTEIVRAWDDYYGWFSYPCTHGCSGALSQEPEGLDYFDLTNPLNLASGPLAGHGQLHAILYDNPITGGKGTTYLKHYYTSLP